VNGALIRYRVMAWIVGVMLLIIVFATIIKYAADSSGLIEVVGPIHGFLYIVYLVTVLDLGMRGRWSGWRIIGVCLAGTVPFFSFFMEHWVTERVKAEMAAAASATS
jgi:integral membrane protein